jgi:hypothetical protein
MGIAARVSKHHRRAAIGLKAGIVRGGFGRGEFWTARFKLMLLGATDATDRWCTQLRLNVLS